jgi:hypothetical protein
VAAEVAGDYPDGVYFVPLVLIRPDGHVAARGRPGSMDAVTGYLRDLFREPVTDREGRPAQMERAGRCSGLES